MFDQAFNMVWVPFLLNTLLRFAVKMGIFGKARISRSLIICSLTHGKGSNSNHQLRVIVEMLCQSADLAPLRSPGWHDGFAWAAVQKESIDGKPEELWTWEL